MRISEFFYTQHEAARVLGVTPATLWRWGKMGRFDMEYIGKTVLIPKWEIELLKMTRGRKCRKIKL
jgi:predicted site-specific integrase-resolvase